MKKYCYSVTGEILFEYEGLLRNAINQYLYNESMDAFSEERSMNLHFSLDISYKTTKGEPVEGLNAMNFDLKGSNFMGTDLYWSTFRESDLEDTNFSYCDLRGVSFNGAVLKNANFENANLSFANIGGGAKLQGADLTGANFCNANLEGTQYDSQTIFPNDFIVPECMIFQRDDETDDEFLQRANEIKTLYLINFITL